MEPTTGLELLLPDLASRLAKCSHLERMSLVRRACERAIRTSGVCNRDVEHALQLLLAGNSDSEARKRAVRFLRPIEEAIDAQYLGIGDDNEHDESRAQAETDAAMRLFRQARAVGALVFALDGSDLVASQRSVFEALASLAGHARPTAEHVRQLLGDAS